MKNKRLHRYFMGLLGFQIDLDQVGHGGGVHGFNLEYSKNYDSFIQKFENMDDIIHNLNNNLFFENLLDFNYNFLIIGLLVIPIFIIGIIILESKPFNEGIKTVVNIGTALVIGTTLAGTGNSRDRDEEERRKQQEEEERKQPEKNERKQQEEDELKQQEEDEKKLPKVEDNSIKIKYTNSNAYILG